tara:strand:- start:435 stop:572 length:138 start_codon:yes stop_codon:yes gene_type:complete
MLTEMAKYSAIIIALAMVNVVWQLEKATQLLRAMNRFLEKGIVDE